MRYEFGTFKGQTQYFTDEIGNQKNSTLRQLLSLVLSIYDTSRYTLFSIGYRELPVNDYCEAGGSHLFILCQSTQVSRRSRLTSDTFAV